MTSDLISVVSNPSGETVSVECRDQDPKVPRQESFSIVSDCAIRVGNSRMNRQGAYIQTGFRWTTGKGIEFKDVIFVSGWISFSIIMMGLIIRFIVWCLSKCLVRHRKLFVEWVKWRDGKT